MLGRLLPRFMAVVNPAGAWGGFGRDFRVMTAGSLFHSYDKLLPLRERVGVVSDGTYSDEGRAAGAGANTRRRAVDRGLSKG